MKTFKTPKGTELQVSDIKGKDYLQVSQRIVWFREEHPTWTIKTSIIEFNSEKKWAVCGAEILDETGRIIANDIKSESAAGFGDYLEKATTGAIGRALALCGYGTQFTGDELDEGERIVDSPIEKPKRATKPVNTKNAALMQLGKLMQEKNITKAFIEEKYGANPRDMELEDLDTLIGDLTNLNLEKVPAGEINLNELPWD